MIPVPPPCFRLEVMLVDWVLDSPVPFVAGSLDGPEPRLEVELVLALVTLVGLDLTSPVLVPPVLGWFVDIPVALDIGPGERVSQKNNFREWSVFTHVFSL